MLNLLVIALEFPPIQVAGAFRALRFVKHLPQCGIRPTVVCFNPAQFESSVHPLNRKLAEQIPPDIELFYLDMSVLENDRRPLDRQVAEQFPGKHFYSFDELFSSIQCEAKPDAIYATFPPFNVDRLVLAAKRFLRRPLVLDMRDAWSQWGSSPFRTWFHYRTILQRERQMLNAADEVISVTPQLIEMEKRLVTKAADRFHWVPNAYEQERLPSGIVQCPAGKARYRVGYVGQFYFNWLYETPEGFVPWYRKKPHRWFHYHATRQRWIYRTPYYFFKAWKHLNHHFPEYRDRFEFHYVGTLQPWLADMAKSMGLEKDCTWHGPKSKQDTQELLSNCDWMLSTSIKIVNGQDYCLASKTFDYIAIRKPVLGFVCEGMQRDFLVGANIAQLFDPDHATSNARQLKDLIDKGFESEINSQYLEQYSPIATTKILAEVVHKLVGGHR